MRIPRRVPTRPRANGYTDSFRTPAAPTRGSITSTWIGSSTDTISGSSTASPRVAGVAALYKHAHGNASTSTIDTWIKNNATTGVITGNVTGTPNRLLYKAAL